MGLLLFLLLGLTTPVLAAIKGFHYVNQRKTWTEAQSYCRDKFTELATIHTQDDWTRVREMIAYDASVWGAWIGLYNDVKSWRWSLDNTSLYHRDLGSWFDFDEDNKGDEPCVVVKNGQLYDLGCQSKRGSVCYHETTDSYIPVPEPMSWQSAQSYCRQSHTDLASIRDQQELDAIINVTDPNVSHWIGLSRDSWKWSDQSESSFRRWASGQPDGGGDDCGAAADDVWYDWRCDKILPFICSGPSRKVLRVTVKTGGSVDLNDPLVQEAILKQMEKDLRGQGLTQELRLSWRKQLWGGVFNKTEL